MCLLCGVWARDMGGEEVSALSAVGLCDSLSPGDRQLKAKGESNNKYFKHFFTITESKKSVLQWCIYIYETERKDSQNKTYPYYKKCPLIFSILFYLTLFF